MTTSDLPPYPPIDPTTFDLIIIGTGLPASLISASSSAAGKSVLHLDPNPFYGSHFSSLSIPDLTSFLNSHSAPHSDENLTLTTRPLFSDVEISNFAPDLLDQHLRKFNLDLSGPRVLFCADKSIDLMLKSGASQYVEFKSVDASFVGDGDGRLWSVPDSRAAIFKDKTLGLMEKNQLMRFFKLVQGHLSENENNGTENGAKISAEDLESPFVEFLSKMKLPPKIKSYPLDLLLVKVAFLVSSCDIFHVNVDYFVLFSICRIVLYAIAMADYDQENTEIHKDLLKTKDGIDRLALYNASIGRFQNALGALIYPIYGQGELPQAFCRRAAVKGCLYGKNSALVTALMRVGVGPADASDFSAKGRGVEDSGSYKGVRLASGQDIFSQKLVLDPSFTVPWPLSSSPCEQMQDTFQVLSLSDDKVKVARGICITKRSLKPDLLNCLVVFPPKSLFPEQFTSIRVLQLSSNLAVCPSGMFVLYFSALCDEVNQGKKLLHAALDALLQLLVSGNSENSSTFQSEDTEHVEPTLLWSALYIQELTKGGQIGSVSSTPMPDGSLNFNDLLDATEKLFQNMYPNEEFFWETIEPENSEDDGGLMLET
ncbi:hypothetical protein JRO89_XS11G0033600 [Xanthoceras sorbifolium]|uniref:Rab escort protein 1 n=1 Tax=Xanthoceras sorbifolium TaxID=99658 RepID=A0ABQ8HEI1_9ROSI|nr:hypothetical protein JRO89_XS11G0033600 [Xanthoceras sorbifolium]